MPNQKIGGYRNVFLFTSFCVFADVLFLHFGELKMRFLHITPFVSKK